MSLEVLDPGWASRLVDMERPDCRSLGVPVGGFYKEILNTDSTNYGGSGVGNLGGLNSEQVTAQDRPHSLLLTLPPLSALIFKPQR